MSIVESINTVKENFDEVKPEGEMCLIKFCTELFKISGVGVTEIDTFVNLRHVKLSINKKIEVQMYLINKALSFQLLSTGQDTVLERSYLKLVDINDYESILKEVIIPFFLRNGLPKRL